MRDPAKFIPRTGHYILYMTYHVFNLFPCNKYYDREFNISDRGPEKAHSCSVHLKTRSFLSYSHLKTRGTKEVVAYYVELPAIACYP